MEMGNWGSLVGRMVLGAWPLVVERMPDVPVGLVAKEAMGAQEEEEEEGMRWEWRSRGKRRRGCRRW